MLVAFTANAQITKWMKPSKVLSTILKGDANGDGEITVADVMLTVNYALVKQGESFNAANADTNGDGEITIAEVMGIVNTILGGTKIEIKTYHAYPFKKNHNLLLRGWVNDPRNKFPSNYKLKVGFLYNTKGNPRTLRLLSGDAFSVNHQPHLRIYESTPKTQHIFSHV